MQPRHRVGSSARVRAKRYRRRQEILREALAAFRERGYHATTLEEIAGRLGITKAALYHYFSDKEEILYTCHRGSLEELEAILERAREMDAPASERLHYLIREHVRVMTDSLAGSPLALEVTALAPEHAERVIRARDRYERGVRQLIAAGVALGEFRPTDPKLAAFAIFGAINWIVRWYRSEGTSQAAEIGEAFADLWVRGLDAHPREAPPRGSLRFRRAAPSRL